MVPERWTGRRAIRAAAVFARPERVVSHLRYKAHGLLESLRYASAGIYFMLRTQRNMRTHVAVGFCAFALGIWLAIKPLELSAIALTSSLVVICEMFNTAVENAVDLATHRRHPLAKAAKDVAAAAVLIAALTAVVVGALLLGPPLYARILEWLAR
ncbi:MAG: diacylglycerol kinase family protein [Candidatus Sericytochromatia bacterium]|nr:diacylglycerol kinase family protein [Candidatus Tanganyikabacteria bacterium]